MQVFYPLSSHKPQETIAYGPQGAISTARFLAQVQSLARQLPARQHVVNTCSNRYCFLLGFAAAVLAGKTTLMPSTVTEHVLEDLQRSHTQDLFILHDGVSSALTSGTLPFIDISANAALNTSSDVTLDTLTDTSAVPMIAASHLAAIVFTSGSTGVPQPHPKTWGSLVNNAQAAARRLQAQGVNIVATVPGQHMYGFESSVLLALLGGSAIWHDKPFFPADIASALAQIPAPRMLVSTPFHLNTCIQSVQTWPELHTVLSATAPMDLQLAQQLEERLQAPLHEIFGSTDTNQIASRRTLAGPSWQLLDWARLSQHNGQTLVNGICLPHPVPIGDHLLLKNELEFELRGRNTDQINVAGKRNSLANMNQLLLRVPGVLDGCYFLLTPEEAIKEQVFTEIIRPCAFVQAPGVSASTIRDYMRQHVDPVFLPRPIWHVGQLPRNAASKLPRAALLALFRELRTGQHPSPH